MQELQPHAITIKHEHHDWAKLPGIDEFVSGIQPHLLSAREKNAIGRVLSWHIIQKCYDYGHREDVRSAIAVMNLKPDGTKREGRPATGHRLAMLATAKKLKLNLNTLEKWQADYCRAVTTGLLKPATLEDLVFRNVTENSETLIAFFENVEMKLAEIEKSDDDGQQLPPEEQGQRAATKILRKFALNERLNPPLMEAIVRAFSPALQRHGYAVVREK